VQVVLNDAYSIYPENARLVRKSEMLQCDVEIPGDGKDIIFGIPNFNLDCILSRTPCVGQGLKLWRRFILPEASSMEVDHQF
jgi:hypothetical protein